MHVGTRAINGIERRYYTRPAFIAFNDAEWVALERGLCVYDVAPFKNSIIFQICASKASPLKLDLVNNAEFF